MSHTHVQIKCPDCQTNDCIICQPEHRCLKPITLRCDYCERETPHTPCKKCGFGCSYGFCTICNRQKEDEKFLPSTQR